MHLALKAEGFDDVRRPLAAAHAHNSALDIVRYGSRVRGESEVYGVGGLRFGVDQGAVEVEDDATDEWEGGEGDGRV